DASLAALPIDNPCAGPGIAVLTAASLPHVTALTLQAYSDPVILKAARLLDSAAAPGLSCPALRARAPGRHELPPGSVRHGGIPEILSLPLGSHLVRREQPPSNNEPSRWRDQCARQDDSAVPLRRAFPASPIFDPA